jgi:hypothetical protein
LGVLFICRRIADACHLSNIPQSDPHQSDGIDEYKEHDDISNLEENSSHLATATATTRRCDGGFIFISFFGDPGIDGNKNAQKKKKEIP